ncbi:MAG: hypothetical protein ABSE90_11095 [Verrucomicrobiota bacterium]|jgi:hypothetical protein
MNHFTISPPRGLFVVPVRAGTHVAVAKPSVVSAEARLAAGGYLFES